MYSEIDILTPGPLHQLARGSAWTSLKRDKASSNSASRNSVIFVRSGSLAKSIRQSALATVRKSRSLENNLAVLFLTSKALPKGFVFTVTSATRCFRNETLFSHRVKETH
jgi:hypothetical protein